MSPEATTEITQQRVTANKPAKEIGGRCERSQAPPINPKERQKKKRTYGRSRN